MLTTDMGKEDQFILNSQREQTSTLGDLDVFRKPEKCNESREVRATTKGG